MLLFQKWNQLFHQLFKLATCATVHIWKRKRKAKFYNGHKLYNGS